MPPFISQHIGSIQLYETGIIRFFLYELIYCLASLEKQYLDPPVKYQHVLKRSE